MGRFAKGFAFVCICSGAYLPAASQITITAADVAAQLTVGNSTVTHADTITASVNIGSPGGGNTWTFSGLLNHFTATMSSVAPASTPYSSQFPGATHALKSTMSLYGVTGDFYQYLTLSTNLLNPGSMAGAATPYGAATMKTTNAPSAVTYGLPATYGSVWTAAYTETEVIAIGGFPMSTVVTSYVDSAWIDAHGTMVIPGGGAYPALRVRLVTRSPGKTVGFIFMAANGASVQVTAADTSSPSYGVIDVDTLSTTWTGPTSVDVAVTGAVPTEYALLQNYPNPFNPTTEITYELPQASEVRLSVFNLLGQEVALLINAKEGPGSHTVRFSGTGLPSGVYLYRLETDHFIQTRRMVLVR
jgi:hypothetical protein